MASHWAVDIAATVVILAVVVPLVILTRRRPARNPAPRLHRPGPRRPFVPPADWMDADLWRTGVHPAPLDPRRTMNVARHRR